MKEYYIDARHHTDDEGSNARHSAKLSSFEETLAWLLKHKEADPALRFVVTTSETVSESERRLLASHGGYLQYNEPLNCHNIL